MGPRSHGGRGGGEELGRGLGGEGRGVPCPCSSSRTAQQRERRKLAAAGFPELTSLGVGVWLAFRGDLDFQCFTRPCSRLLLPLAHASRDNNHHAGHVALGCSCASMLLPLSACHETSDGYRCCGCPVPIDAADRRGASQGSLKTRDYCRSSCGFSWSNLNRLLLAHSLYRLSPARC